MKFRQVNLSATQSVQPIIQSVVDASRVSFWLSAGEWKATVNRNRWWRIFSCVFFPLSTVSSFGLFSLRLTSMMTEKSVSLTNIDQTNSTHDDQNVRKSILTVFCILCVFFFWFAVALFLFRLFHFCFVAFSTLHYLTEPNNNDGKTWTKKIYCVNETKRKAAKNLCDTNDIEFSKCDF